MAICMRNLGPAGVQMVAFFGLAAFIMGRGWALFADRPLLVSVCLLLGLGLAALGVSTIERRLSWLTAVHEAGHVAVAVDLWGHTDITSVVIHRDGAGETTSTQAASGDAFDEALGAVLYGGCSADRVVFGRDNFGCGHDLDRVRSLRLDEDLAQQVEAQARTTVERNLTAIKAFAHVLFAARALSGDRLQAALLSCGFAAGEDS